jgi:flagellar hook-associated protein 1 FlgK
MSFETSLWTGVSGLLAAQRQLEVASHNIANVNTPGYSRQRVELEASRPTPGSFGSRSDGMLGTGVTITDVLRLRNSLTDGAYWTESGNTGAANARAEVLQRAESILGPVGGGVPAGLSKFWAAWDDLSLNANDTAARQGVLDAGKELAGQLRSASGQLDRIQSDVSANIAETVGNINRLAQQAAELNQAIKEAVAADHSPNDLMDQRDHVLDQLTDLTGGQVVQGEMGTKNLFVSNRALVMGGDFETMTAKTGVPGGAAWTLGNASVNSTGRLGGLTEMLNVTLPSIRSDLDNFAVGLRDLINTAQTAGFDQDGNAGQAFFTGASARDIDVNAALSTRGVAAASAATTAPNDASNALNIAGLRSAAAVGTSTLNQSIQGLAGRLGGMAASAQHTASASKDMLDSISGQRLQESSVSTDEELANIVRFQHAYQAAAKVIQVVDSCLDTLVNLVRS